MRIRNISVGPGVRSFTDPNGAETGRRLRRTMRAARKVLKSPVPKRAKGARVDEDRPNAKRRKKGRSSGQLGILKAQDMGAQRPKRLEDEPKVTRTMSSPNGSGSIRLSKPLPTATSLGHCGAIKQPWPFQTPSLLPTRLIDTFSKWRFSCAQEVP